VEGVQTSILYSGVKLYIRVLDNIIERKIMVLYLPFCMSSVEVSCYESGLSSNSKVPVM
jgi:hypothetical protein